jgi:hypothetical protein
MAKEKNIKLRKIKKIGIINENYSYTAYLYV